MKIMKAAAEGGADAAQKTADELPAPFSFSEMFGNGNPVELEIGCGKGKFLVARAEAEPGINFIGMDYAGKWMKIGETRSLKRRLPNLKFIKGEARQLLARIPNSSVTVVHIYFPDPWPKRRHQKRRIVTAEFLQMLWSKLGKLGRIEMATDQADYYEQMQAAARHSPELWKRITEAVNVRIAFPEFRTNYEIKYAAEGRQLRYMELEKNENR